MFTLNQLELFFAQLNEDLFEFNNCKKEIAISYIADWNGNPIAHLYLTDMEQIDYGIILHCNYIRKYFQTIVKKGNAIAGWSKENKKEQGIYIPIKIYVDKHNPIINYFILRIESIYNGQQIETALKIKGNNDILDDYDYTDIHIDTDIINDLHNYPTIISEIESKTVNSLLYQALTLLLIRIKNILCELDINEET